MRCEKLKIKDGNGYRFINKKDFNRDIHQIVESKPSIKNKATKPKGTGYKKSKSKK